MARPAPCSKCGGSLRADNKVGICTRNAECRKANRARYHVVNEVREFRQGLLRPPWGRLHGHAQERARRKGVPFEITPEDIRSVWRDTCPVFGVSLTINKGCVGPTSYTLDRIEPAKGYVPGNIQILSHKANSMKRDATREELLQFARWVLDQEGIAHE